MEYSLDLQNFLHSTQSSDVKPEFLQILQHGTATQFLNVISKAALEPHLTEHILIHFEPLIPDICARWTTDASIPATVAAFGRILAAVPYLAEQAVTVLESKCQEIDVADDAESDQELLLGIVRLLSIDNKLFAPLLKPAKFSLMLQHPLKSVRYLAVRTICLYLHAPDAMLQDMISKYAGDGVVDSDFEGKTIDYFFFSLWEEERVNRLTDGLRSARAERLQRRLPKGPPKLIRSDDLSTRVANIEGLLLPRNPHYASASKSNLTVVPTATTKHNIRALAEATLKPNPILVTGLAGSGKSLAINYLASEVSDSSSLVTLHLNEQSDAKLLLGVYTTENQSGQFKWQPGVLTKAIKEGRWVILEDLNRVPNDVMSVLLPLIERHEIRIPGQDEILHAAQGFRLLATMRTQSSADGKETMINDKIIGRRLWNNVQFESQSLQEIREIITFRHPLLQNYLANMLGVYDRLRREIFSTSLKGKVRLSRARQITTRDLFKWCVRSEKMLLDAGARTGNEPISEQLLDNIFLDAADCFAGGLEDEQAREQALSCIAEVLHVNPQRKTHLITSRVPHLKQSEHANHESNLKVGRASLQHSHRSFRFGTRRKNCGSEPFALNNHVLRLMEQTAMALQRREPLLLVGETGIGKTASIQHLSRMLDQELIAINMSQQSESGDLLGGFKPVNPRTLVIPLKDEFDALFEETFSQKKNQKFADLLTKCIAKAQWRRVIGLWKEAVKMVDQQVNSLDANSDAACVAESGQRSKRRKVDGPLNSETKERWTSFAGKVQDVERRIQTISGSFAFSFQEGKLLSAVREGKWVLLDEINLATPDTLECLTDLLETGADAAPSILVSETGNADRIDAHPNFRIIAAMNPATDVGKKDLPMGIRSRFTEIFVVSPDSDFQSLQAIIDAYMSQTGREQSRPNLPRQVVELYLKIQSLASSGQLGDGTGQRPQYSVRTLTRALSHMVTISPLCSIRRALYEGLSMCFLTCLDSASEARVREEIKLALFKTEQGAKVELKKPLRHPEKGNYATFSFQIEPVDEFTRANEGRHWLPQGTKEPETPANYIVTPYIARNLENLARAASTKKFPVLIQGPTSAGKTSMIEYLAKRSGNELVRINNHEHTDIQEYLGTYVSGVDGQLTFQDGVLVQALRKGHWVILDELNLAPTDVLEALNRLLDDNRELLVAETQEVVRPHPNFMLFATQNPVGAYGGRKALSKAFQNRFLELHFEDIPVAELNIILSRRSQLPRSWCSLIVEVYKKLSQMRQETKLFENHGFATLRDLFRWAFRGADSLQMLANNGYMLLAEKVRKLEERKFVKETIEQVISRKGNRVFIDENALYEPSHFPEMKLYDGSDSTGIVWTKSMRRLFGLVCCAARNDEPVLLVGETGCGKTAACQMLSRALEKRLYTVNAHQNLETGDMIGAQRPNRDRVGLDAELFGALNDVFQGLGVTTKSNALHGCLTQYEALPKDSLDSIPSPLRTKIKSLIIRRKALFHWQNGPLVHAMQRGQHFLLDEISLADDAVLERLNSVLDPQRSLLLAEKGSLESVVHAQQGFQLLATMNPGGDFGKKELSPALRNRFTEIWMPSLTDSEDTLLIVQAKLLPSLAPYAEGIVQFAKWFGHQFTSSNHSSLSVRDILSWVELINMRKDDPLVAILDGALTIFIDTLGANPSGLVSIGSMDISVERKRCIETLGNFLQVDLSQFLKGDTALQNMESFLRIGRFSLPIVGTPIADTDFNFEARTTQVNTLRIIRGLQLSKPILLEGAPGVGKTSLISALAKASGNKLTRINLSEQTDLMDLFGSDAPLEDADIGVFGWKDAPFLTAMKHGHWVLLDEMNLASQSILEGLNACIDHRGEAYIAELDKAFIRHPSFRLFATQNPHHQGGGRKGLPASFVNRFTVVYADIFERQDLELICSRAYPNVDDDKIKRLVQFVSETDRQVHLDRHFGSQGSPWEFNLRDSLRFLGLLSSQEGLLQAGSVTDFVDILFKQCFRSTSDSEKVDTIATRIFGSPTSCRQFPTSISPTSIQIGLGLLPRTETPRISVNRHCAPVKRRLPLMESLMICVTMNWPVLLTGTSGAGKSHAINALASVVGADVDVLSVSSDVDANDLIGAYEQVDLSRNAQCTLGSIQRWVQSTLCSLLRTIDLGGAGQLIHNLFDLVNLSIKPENAAFPDHDLEVHRKHLELLQAISQENSDNTRSLGNAAGTFLSEIENIEQHDSSASAARFKWIDGVLIKALEQGRWLVLDNVNFCSSSVLDRLNSLLEPNGTLIVNENCSEDGAARVVRPHPDFRIFLTLDPRYGEVSRAMRNRAVELYVEPSQASNEPYDDFVSLESSIARYRDLSQILKTDCEPRPCELVAKAVAGRISFGDLNKLESFCTQVQRGLLRSTSQNSVVGLTNDLLTFREEHPSILQSCYESYNSLSTLKNGQDLQRYQPINPVHHVLCAKEQGQNDPAILPLARVWGLQFEIIGLERNFQHARNRHAQTGVSYYLRQSLPGPRLQTNGHYFSTIVRFLMESLSSVQHWLNHQVQITSDDAMESLDLAEWFVFFWKTLYDAVDGMNCEEAVIRSYVAVGQKNVGRMSDGLTKISLSKDLERNFDSCLEKEDKATGMCMEPLWQKFKPWTVSTLDRFDAVSKLEDFAQWLDEMATSPRVDIAQLKNTRDAIVRSGQMAYQEDIPIHDLSQELQSQALLNSKIPSEEVESGRSLFGKAFEAICKLGDIIPASPRRDLTLWSGRSTVPCLLPPPTNAYGSLAAIASFVGDAPDVGMHAADPNLQVLRATACANDIKLNFLDSARAETVEVGKALINFLDTSRANLIAQLRKQVCKLILHVFTSLEDVIAPQWIADAELLNESTEDASEHISNLLRTVRVRSTANPSSSMRDIFTYFLKPAANLLAQESNMSGDPWQACAKALILVAIGGLQLYIPKSIQDPASKLMQEKRLHEKRLLDLRQNLETFSKIELHYTRQSDNLMTEFLEDQMEALQPPAAAIEVYRPDTPKLSNLNADFQNALMVAKRVEMDYAENDYVQHATGGVADQALEMVNRFSREYRGYSDLSFPVIGFLQCLRLGYTLAPTNCKQFQSPTESDIGIIRELTPLCGTGPVKWAFPESNLLERILQSKPELELYAMKSLSLRSVCQSPNYWPLQVQKNLDAILASLHGNWKSKLQSDKQKHEADSSLYQYRGDYSDEEAADEEDFENLFETPSVAKGNHPVNDPKGLATIVADLHLRVFVNHDPSSKRLEELLREASSSIGKLMKVNQRDVPLETLETLPATLLTLEQFSFELQGTKKSDNAYNIYTDPNIPEARRLGRILREIEITFSSILEVWPEHATLSNVLEFSRQILSSSYSETLMKLIGKVEQVHKLIAEWQQVASSQYSAVGIFNSLTDLLISWRQIELSTWARLLEVESEKCNDDAKSWWFIAYEAIVLSSTGQPSADDEHEQYTLSCIQTLEDLLRNASLGQFEQKLEIIESLQRHAEMTSSSEETHLAIWKAIKNFTAYFSRFMPLVRTKIGEQRALLEKEIKNVIQLASWRDRNIAALRQSAKASHRKLFKVVRKYRDILNQPVGPILQQALSGSTTQTTFDNSREGSHSAQLDPTASAFCKAMNNRWQSRPDRFKNLDATFAKLNSLFHHEVQRVQVDDFCEDFLSSLDASAKNLRQATPTFLTEENKSLAKHLTTRKRKLFSDTLKELRTMGLRANQSPRVLAEQDSLARILVRLPDFENMGRSPNAQEGFSLFFTSLGLLPQARSATQKHSDDLNQADISRSVGLLEGLVAVTTSQQHTTSQHSSRLSFLEQELRRISVLWENSDCNVKNNSTPIEDQSEDARTPLLWLPMMVATTKRVLEAQENLGSLDFSILKTKLSEWESRFGELTVQINSEDHAPKGLMTSATGKLDRELKADLAKFRDDMIAETQKEPLVKPILDHLLPWATPYARDAGAVQNGVLSTSITALETEFFSVLDMILASVHDVHKVKSLYPQSQEDNDWFTQTIDVQRRTLAAFNANKINSSLSALLDKLHTLQENGSEDTLKYACASLTLGHPIIQQYHNSYLREISDFETTYHQSCKMLHTLLQYFCQIAEHGFCQPQEKSEEQGRGDEKLEGGTGLGAGDDGEGAEDISKDVGEDEDLSELAQAPDESKREGETQDNKDAVDVDDEMQGQEGDGAEETGENEPAADDDADSGAQDHDIADEKAEGGDGRDEPGEEDGMDEVVGDVDDFEPSAVDEKFWDEAGNEDNNAKEGKEASGKMDKSEKVAGPDDQKKEDQAEGAPETDKQAAKDSGSDESMSEANNADEDSELGPGRPDDTMDPYVDERENLDLPEDLNLDGKDATDGAEEGFDLDEGMGSEPEDLDMQEEEARKAQEELDREEAGENANNVDEQDTERDEAERQASDDAAPQEESNEAESQNTATDQHPEEDDPSGGYDQGGLDRRPKDEANQRQEQYKQGLQSPDEDQTSNGEEEAQNETAPNTTGTQSGSLGAPQQDQTQGRETSQDTPQSRELETIRKLGNILEQWHRKQSRIHEKASTQDSGQAAQKDVNMADAEFEHLQDEQDQGDAQALGASTKDQAQALDTDMELRDEKDEDQAAHGSEEFMPDVTDDAGSEDQDIDMQDAPAGQLTEGEGHKPTDADSDLNQRPGSASPLANEDSEKDIPSDDESLSDVGSNLETMTLSPPPPTDPYALWTYHENLTHPHTQTLTSHLRLILHPTRATKLRGDHRTGKRLNLKRIIPFIASNYRRDKIWLRRSVPSKRAYQVLLAIDDSKSMAESGAGGLALSTLALVGRALEMLEVGEVGVVRFGAEANVAHELGKPFTRDAGADALSQFGFSQQKTDVRKLVERSIDIFREARLKSHGSDSELWQLQLIISDGICEDHDRIRRLLMTAQEERMMMVFVIVDGDTGARGGTSSSAGRVVHDDDDEPRPPAQHQKQQQPKSNRQSILNLETVDFVQETPGANDDEDDTGPTMPRLVRKKYLDTFPFKYYLVVRDVRELPEVLAGALRRWFEEVRDL
ncbi:MAG: hypothetical protein M1831_003940 [Alyxoria varia]|nr:MAG: hypothetical protein M1831_003940 [Alyxoria varia]